MEVIMKRKILIFVIIYFAIFCCSGECLKVHSLEDFFNNNSYITVDYSFYDLKFHFSYVNADNSDQIIAKGIFYTGDVNNIKQLLVVANEKIYNDEELLFVGKIITQQFYGYKIDVIEINKCIATDFYTNLGKNVADGPTFLWNSSKKRFEVYKIDPSEY